MVDRWTTKSYLIVSVTFQTKSKPSLCKTLCFNVSLMGVEGGRSPTPSPALL